MALAVLFTAGSVRATPTLTTLVSFPDDNFDGPYFAGVTFGADGNLYGTTANDGIGYGSVFELSGQDHKTLTTLHAFDNDDGAQPWAGVTVDGAGNIYGTTFQGGTYPGNGTVFQLSGTNHTTFKTLLNFTDQGVNPQAGVTLDSAGNIYGTTSADLNGPGGGTVFELSGPGHDSLKTVVDFDGSIGDTPSANLRIDSAGNIYGTNYFGGQGGSGTVFELSGPTHQTSTALASFNGSNGALPNSDITFDAAGNIYGTTTSGGPGGDGTVFELSGPNYQTMTILAAFDGTNGTDPLGGLIIDAAGNIFGTSDGPVGTEGSIFELSGPNHTTLTTLATFDGADGSSPRDDLSVDANGNLYGTTTFGGQYATEPDRGGTVFELSGSGFVVPEPTSLALLGVTGTFFTFGRRGTQQRNRVVGGRFDRSRNTSPQS